MLYCMKCHAKLEIKDTMYCACCGADLRRYMFPMRWFHFLIYFSLWAGGISGIVMGAYLLFTGATLTQMLAQLNMQLPAGFHGLMIAAGVLTLVSGGFSIYTRFRLARFKKDGPMCLYILYAASLAGALLVNIASGGIAGAFTFRNIISYVASVSVIFFNWQYFDRRRWCFEVGTQPEPAESET